MNVGGEANEGREDRSGQRALRDKCSRFGGGENHCSATTIEDKMSLSSVLNIVIGCREDECFVRDKTPHEDMVEV